MSVDTQHRAITGAFLLWVDHNAREDSFDELNAGDVTRSCS